MVAVLAPSADRGARRPSAATYRRRRTVAAGLVVAAVIALWLAVHGLLAGPPATFGSGTQPIVQRVWVVHPGDTLWSIALASGARGDIRPVVDALSAEVHGQPLQVGQRILLP